MQPYLHCAILILSVLIMCAHADHRIVLKQLLEEVIEGTHVLLQVGGLVNKLTPAEPQAKAVSASRLRTTQSEPVKGLDTSRRSLISMQCTLTLTHDHTTRIDSEHQSAHADGGESK